MQLRLPKVLPAWLKLSSSHDVPPIQSRLSRLRLLDISLRDGRQLESKEWSEKKQDKARFL